VHCGWAHFDCTALLMFFPFNEQSYSEFQSSFHFTRNGYLLSPVSIVMVLMVPMPFVKLPAFAIVIVMRMVPIGAFIWRTLPPSCNPAIAMSARCPIPVDPSETRRRDRPSHFVTKRWRRCSDVDRNLSKSWDGQSCCEQCGADAKRFHIVS
jgi:hypothetical protein